VSLVADPLGSLEASTQALRSYFEGFGVAGVHASVVLSETGEAVDASGVSALLSSPIDRFWLGVLRGGADAIVTSGATVRAEQIRQTETTLVIATRTGDITGLRPLDGAELLIASDATCHSSWPAHAKHIGSFSSLAEIVAFAAKRWTRVQVELGVENLLALHLAGQIDTVFITSPTRVQSFGFGAVDLLCEFDSLVLSRTR
jgi:hypothetical protein